MLNAAIMYVQTLAWHQFYPFPHALTWGHMLRYVSCRVQLGTLSKQL